MNIIGISENCYTEDFPRDVKPHNQMMNIDIFVTHFCNQLPHITVNNSVWHPQLLHQTTDNKHDIVRCKFITEKPTWNSHRKNKTQTQQSTLFLKCNKKLYFGSTLDEIYFL